MRQHLIDRGLNPDLYGVTYDEDKAEIPLTNIIGRTVGYLRYRPTGDKKSKDNLRYKMIMPSPNMGFFGTESLSYPGPVYVVEGVFKACKLHKLKKASIALCGSDYHYFSHQLFILAQVRKLIAIGDNDDAGRKFSQGIERVFKGRGLISPLDLDEMSDNDVERLINVWQ